MNQTDLGSDVQATGEEPPPQALAVFGAASAVASTAATFPLEVVRRRAMVGMNYPNTLAALTGIAAAEGLGALYNVRPVVFCVKCVPRGGMDVCGDELPKTPLLR